MARPGLRASRHAHVLLSLEAKHQQACEGRPRSLQVIGKRSCGQSPARPSRAKLIQRGRQRRRNHVAEAMGLTEPALF